jgi:hypothetical protein
MIDIGIVHYRIKNENEIDAVWYSSRLGKKEIGKGIAIGDTSNGFPGEYEITYFDPDGNNTGTFDLKIIKSGLVHELYLSLDDRIEKLDKSMSTAIR